MHQILIMTVAMGLLLGACATQQSGSDATEATIATPPQPTQPPEPSPSETTSLDSPETIQCGQIIIEDTVLTEDLVCPGIPFAIQIGASNVRLDLSGHVISGQSDGEGILVSDVEGITISNGTLESFNIAIVVGRTSDVTLENLTIRNLDIDDPDHFISGVVISCSHNVAVREILFDFLPVGHKEAVILDNSEAAISNIELQNGSVGINFGGACDQENTRSRGTVLNSRFSGTTIAAILVQCSNNAKIAGNEFLQTEVAIATDPSLEGRVSSFPILPLKSRCSSLYHSRQGAGSFPG